jgi:hypothetical protein
MGELWTPMREANAEREAMVDNHIKAGREVDKALKELDRHLSVVFFGDNAEPYPGIVPGRWHIRRQNPETLDSYFPLQTPEGEYREPTMGDVERLKGADLWTADGMKRMRQQEENRRRAQEREQQRHAEDRQAEIASRIEIDRDRVKHAKGLRIPGYGLPK